MSGWWPVLLGAGAALLVAMVVLLVVDLAVRERVPVLADYGVIVLCTAVFIIGAVLVRAPDLVVGVMTRAPGTVVESW